MVQDQVARRLRDWKAADGAFAVFALPFPPFLDVVPLLFWALVEDAEGAGSIVGLVTEAGQVVPVDAVRRGVFCDYVRSPQPEDQVQAVYAAAKAEGERLYAELLPGSTPTPKRLTDAQRDAALAHLAELAQDEPDAEVAGEDADDADDVAVAALPRSRHRSRRRRRR